MLSFILVWCGVLIFIRLFLNKFDIQHKDLISVGLSLGLTVFLTLIQWVIDLIMNLIF